MEQKALEELASRLESIESSIARIERRLERLEGIEGIHPLEAEGNHGSIVERVTESAPEDIRFDFTLIGRSFFVLAGAYLLRAATESAIVPTVVGIGLGLLYALVFIVFAWRAAARGARPSASFHGGIALLVAFPLIAEATLHFDLLVPLSAASLIALVMATSFAVCFRYRLRTLSWLTVVATLAVLVVLTFRTHDMLPYMWVLLGLVMVTRKLSNLTKQHLLWPVSAVGDLFVPAAAWVLLSGRSKNSPGEVLLYLAAYFATFAVGALARAIRERDDSRSSEMLQVSIATLVTMLSGARIAASGLDGAAGTGFEIFALTAGIAFAVFSLRVFVSGEVLGLNARFWTTLGIFLTLGSFAMFTSGIILAAVATLVAVTVLVAARHLKGGFLELHAVVALSIAAVASSLGGHAVMALLASPGRITPIGAPAHVLLPLALIVAFVAREAEPDSHWEVRTAKVLAILLAVVLSFGALITIVVKATHAQAAAVATIRTAVLVAGVIGLAALSRVRRLRSARILVYPVLVLTGLKLIFEDFRVGSAATLFLALALYGAAVIFAPRLKWKEPDEAPGESGDDPHPAES